MIDAVTTDVLLRYLAACRQATVPGRPGPNVVRMDGRRADGYAPATVNHRLAAISGLFEFRSMRDPDAKNPVPRGKEARRLSAGERNGLARSRGAPPETAFSTAASRTPAASPCDWTTDEVVALVGACGHGGTGRSPGLMVFCGLRAGEVLALDVADVDIGGRWLRVSGKGVQRAPCPA